MRCEQKKCENEATAAFCWPGSQLRAACAGHMSCAHIIADAMGFYLAEYPLAEREGELARDAVTRLEHQSKP